MRFSRISGGVSPISIHEVIGPLEKNERLERLRGASRPELTGDERWLGELPGADCAFDGAAVDRDAAIGQEAAKAVALSGDVGECLAPG
jgi:hypothetical protein